MGKGGRRLDSPTQHFSASPGCNCQDGWELKDTHSWKMLRWRKHNGWEGRKEHPPAEASTFMQGSSKETPAGNVLPHVVGLPQG